MNFKDNGDLRELTCDHNQLPRMNHIVVFVKETVGSGKRPLVTDKWRTAHVLIHGSDGQQPRPWDWLNWRPPVNNSFALRQLIFITLSTYHQTLIHQSRWNTLIPALVAHYLVNFETRMLIPLKWFSKWFYSRTRRFLYKVSVLPVSEM